MARRASIADAVVSRPVVASTPPTSEPAGLIVETVRRGGKGAGRAGKKGIAFWVHPAAAKQLGLISLDEDKTIQALMEEALDLLFRSRGKHGLAQPPSG
jgi:hypothetical protein